MPSNLILLILAAILMAAGGIVGYEVGKGVRHVVYEEGRQAGKAEMAASIDAQGQAQAAEAQAARASAELPGALQRLRQNWCRDCQ